LELFFRFCIPACHKPAPNINQSYQILHYDNDWSSSGMHTIGKWGKHPIQYQVNSDGWLNPLEYQKEKIKPRIGVIGDSFVAALQVKPNESFHQRLDQLYGDSIEVYSFGYSGAPLSQYLKMALYAEANFHPDLFIVNLCYNDFDESLNHLNRNEYFWTYDILSDSTFRQVEPLIEVPHHWLKRRLTYSATYRYLFFNLTIHKLQKRRNREKKLKEVKVVDKLLGNRSEIEKVIAHIFMEFKRAFPEKRILFVADGPRRTIYNKGSNQSSRLWLNDYLAQQCKKQGFEYIDLIPFFIEDYEQNKLVFEFEEDGHWNAHAHRLVGDVIYNYLNEE
jgi:hypothetical protein